MAFLQLRSTNPDLSFVIQKNPSAPMLAKKIKKGVAYGYYGEDGAYNVYFQDAFDEMSFGKEDEYEYLDVSRYDSPIFPFTAIREFFGTPLARRTEKDVPSDHEIFLPNLHVARGRGMHVMSEISDTLGVSVSDDGVLLWSKNRTVHEFLNYAYAFFVLDIFFGHSPLFLDTSVAVRVAEAMNVIGADYLPRYLAKMLAVRTKAFDAAKEKLAAWSGHTYVPDGNATSQESRLAVVEQQIVVGKSVADIGAGDGQLVPAAKRLMSGHAYYAFDRDEKMQEILNRRAKGADNVFVYPLFDPHVMTDKYVAIMSEVIEHNEKREAKQLLLSVLMDANCEKAVVTTPNRAFNVNFPDAEAFRHDDHKFEFDQSEFRDFVIAAMDEAATMLMFEDKDLKLVADFFGVGDVVDSEPMSQMAVIKKVV